MNSCLQVLPVRKPTLEEADLRVPSFLPRPPRANPGGPIPLPGMYYRIVYGARRCAYCELSCRSLIHRIDECPKLEQAQRQTGLPSDEAINAQYW